MSSIIHQEDGGPVHSSIRDDGTIIHWCDKCNALWVSEEKPESQLSTNVRIESRKMVLKIKEAMKLSETVRAHV